MAIIGTSTQPGFYEEKAAKAGQLIQMLLAQQSQRQARQDAQEKEQLNFFFQAVEKDPSIANAMGPDLVKRYGEKYPVLPAIVQSMQQKQKILGDVDSATKEFTSIFGDMQNNYKAIKQHADSQPDTLPFNVHVPQVQGQVSTGSGSPWLDQQAINSNASYAGAMSQYTPPLTLQMPNPGKARAQAILGQINPMMFPVSAAMSMSPEKQILLRMNPAVAHVLPEMPSLQDVPEAQRPIILGQIGAIGPDSVRVARESLGDIPKPAALQEQGAKQAAEEYKQTQENTRASDDRTWQQKKIAQELENRKTIESITDTHAKQRIGQNISGQAGLIKLRHNLEQNDDGTVPWKALADSSSAEVKDWQTNYKDFLSQQKDSKKSDADLQAATNDWMAKNPKPVRIPETVARLISLKLNRRVKADPNKAEGAAAAAENAAEVYRSLMARPGMTPSKAMEQLFPPGF